MTSTQYSTSQSTVLLVPHVLSLLQPDICFYTPLKQLLPMLRPSHFQLLGTLMAIFFPVVFFFHVFLSDFFSLWVPWKTCFKIKLLIIWKAELEREWFFHTLGGNGCTGSQHQGLGHAGIRGLVLYLGLLCGCKGPNSWTIYCSFQGTLGDTGLDVGNLGFKFASIQNTDLNQLCYKASSPSKLLSSLIDRFFSSL